MKPESQSRKRARGLLNRAGYKAGGHVTAKEARSIADSAVHRHERHDHKGEPLTKFRDGGAVEGHKGHRRLDKRARGGALSEAGKTSTYPLKKLNAAPEFANGYARGGRTKGKGAHVNVIVAMPHGGPEGAPGGAAPQGPGADPQTAFKAGVMQGAMAAKRAQMAGAAPGGMPPGGAPAMPPRPMAAAMKRGGRVPHMTAGAGSGEGRLEKAEALEHKGRR